jgi:hypothetical protein
MKPAGALSYFRALAALLAVLAAVFLLTSLLLKLAGCSPIPLD